MDEYQDQPDQPQSPARTLTILAIVGFVLFYASGQHKPGPEVKLTPKKELLGTIVAAFAYNLEQDGKQPVTAIVNTADLADAFNLYGARTSSGQAYKAAFPDVFRTLGLGIKQAAEETTEARSMEDKTAGGRTVREAIVGYLQNAASELQAGRFRAG
jgi:hypothetical protein